MKDLGSTLSRADHSDRPRTPALSLMPEELGRVEHVPAEHRPQYLRNVRARTYAKDEVAGVMDLVRARGKIVRRHLEA
jgi:hypothetical protein